MCFPDGFPIPRGGAPLSLNACTTGLAPENLYTSRTNLLAMVAFATVVVAFAAGRATQWWPSPLWSTGAPTGSKAS